MAAHPVCLAIFDDPWLFSVKRKGGIQSSVRYNLVLFYPIPWPFAAISFPNRNLPKILQ
jgi:hypothetical protein